MRALAYTEALLHNSSVSQQQLGFCNKASGQNHSLPAPRPDGYACQMILYSPVSCTTRHLLGVWRRRELSERHRGQMRCNSTACLLGTPRSPSRGILGWPSPAAGSPGRPTVSAVPSPSPAGFCIRIAPCCKIHHPATKSPPRTLGFASRLSVYGTR